LVPFSGSGLIEPTKILFRIILTLASAVIPHVLLLGLPTQFLFDPTGRKKSRRTGNWTSRD
jgi:hypothetical protein